MCDPCLDRDMYDHSTNSGNWVGVDPVRSDPRWSMAMAKFKGNEMKAFEYLTKNDTKETKLSALKKFLKGVLK